jgi:imidazolonepropionase-like amidohydrolase
VQTANDYGMKVMAHAHGAEGIKRALRAGVISIEHGTLMDDEALNYLKNMVPGMCPLLSQANL